MKGPWWRWWRWNIKGRSIKHPPKPWNAIVKALALISALVAADQLSKHFLVSPGGWHEPDTYWRIEAIVLLPIYGAFLCFAPTQMAAAFATAGLLGNTMSVAILGAAPNPFLMFPNGNGIAFNLADVFALVGFILVIVAIPAIIQARPRRQPA